MWKRRYLTPLGKITVIKSLLVPTLNHLFISIPNPNNQTIKELNNIFLEFVWEGPAKIKYNIIIKQYCDGGLKMINLKAFMNSMKLTWLRRMVTSNSPWQEIIRNKICFKELFSLGTSYIENILKNIKNKFWIDVLKAYSELIQKNQQVTEEYFLASPIFNNQDIKVGSQPVWIKHWYKKGVRFVNDLINENGEFYSKDESERIYVIKANFIQFQGLVQTIKVHIRPHNVRSFTKKLQSPFIPTNIHLLIKSKKGGKDFYTILCTNTEKPTSQPKWNSIYNIEDETWKSIYQSPFKLPIGTMLQWFQTRINHRILPTRKYLHNLKYTQSPNCNFCREEETISHMLWKCPESQSLINSFIRWTMNYNIHITFIEELFIFNIGNTYSAVEFQILMIIKHYIYTAKRLNQPLSLVALQKKLQYFNMLEHYTTTKNNCLGKFEKRWSKYKDLLQSIQWTLKSSLPDKPKTFKYLYCRYNDTAMLGERKTWHFSSYSVT